jgi:hypothetical protein
MSEQNWDPTKIIFLDRGRTFRADIKLDFRQPGEVGPPGEQSPDGSNDAPVVWEEVPEGEDPWEEIDEEAAEGDKPEDDKPEESASDSIT